MGRSALRRIGNMQTYELWIEEFKKEPITKQRIEDEIDEVRGTISNERLWAKGADYPNMHYDNIEQLEQYLDYLYECAQDYDN